MSKKIIWIDTETTGLDCHVHGLREVAVIIEVKGATAGTNALFDINSFTYKKDIVLDKYVSEVMGVSVEGLMGNRDSSLQFKNFEKLLSEYVDTSNKDDRFIVAGYNVDFDVGFIKEWFNDNGSKNYSKYFSHQTLDVLSLVRHLKHVDCFETSDSKLETMCEYFDIEIDAHNAQSDIRATKQLYNALTKYIRTY